MSRLRDQRERERRRRRRSSKRQAQARQAAAARSGWASISDATPWYVQPADPAAHLAGLLEMPC